MSGRVVAGLAVFVAWFAGLGMLMRREYFRPHIERLAEAALRVQPAAVFYAVMQGDRQVGFASSTIDTATAMIEQRDYLVADLPGGGSAGGGGGGAGAAPRRTTARTTITLTRTLRVRAFEVELDTGRERSVLRGTVIGDSVLQYVRGPGTDTQRIALRGPILLPSLAPLAVALDDRPTIGKSTMLPVFDPSTLVVQDARFDVRAESLFVVNDSSVFDPATNLWRGVLPDTMRAWQIVSQSGMGVSGWMDQQGRLVASTQLGFRLERRPYEVAFENWRRDADRGTGAARPPAAPASDRSGISTTLIAAGQQPGAPRPELRVRVRGFPLDGLALNGGRQRRQGDTVIVRREEVHDMAPRYELPIGRPAIHRDELKAEPFLEVDHPEIVALAQRVTGGSRDPRVTAQLLNQWVRDSVAKAPTAGIPSALHVLHTRRGDANEHTQLFAALARAAGLPTRIVAGVVHVDGRFYYHAWPEVLLRSWVAVDPTFGRFPADASYLRLFGGGAGHPDLQRALGALTIDVLGTR